MRDSTPEPRPDREVRPLSGHPDYRRLRRDFPPGGETTREQGFGAPADQYPPAEQASEEYVENPAAAAGGESAPDEPDLPPPEGALPDHEPDAEDVPGEPDAGAAPEDVTESEIDEALIGTFPASDPIAVPDPRR